VVVVSDRLEAVRGLKVKARVLDLGLAEKFVREATVDVPADGVVRAFEIPVLQRIGPAYFVRLDLADAGGAVVSTNTYWLATRDDVLDFAKTEWFYTPVQQHADLTAVARLPPTTLALDRIDDSGVPGQARVRVSNAGPALAFQVRLKLTEGPVGHEYDPTPVFWDDNYFALLPGESREVAVSYESRSAARPVIEAVAWNAPAVQR
jgi:exo-1,4-beta-D-glucosaminidase